MNRGVRHTADGTSALYLCKERLNMVNRSPKWHFWFVISSYNAASGSNTSENMWTWLTHGRPVWTVKQSCSYCGEGDAVLAVSRFKGYSWWTKWHWTTFSRSSSVLPRLLLLFHHCSVLFIVTHFHTLGLMVSASSLTWHLADRGEKVVQF